LVSMRDAFGQELVNLGRKDKRVVVLDADVAHPTRAYRFKEEFPERFLYIGVAEANMMGIAAGLALMGFVPFANTFAVFASKRAYDQVSISIAYPKLNVKIVGAYAGLTTENTGATHQSVEDVAIMRAMPNMMVVEPADTFEVRELLSAIVQYEGPVYFRIIRNEVPRVFPESHTLSLGKGAVLREGGDATIVGAGLMVSLCLKAAEILAKEGINCRVISIHCIKPIDEELIIRAAKETGAIVTAENHGIIGGLGGAVAEVLVENAPVPMERVGIGDAFGRSGVLVDLLKKYGMTCKDICVAVRKAVERKGKDS